MAWVDEGINTYVRDLIKPVLHSSYTKSKPLMAWLIGQTATGKDRLGDPNVGALFGGMDLGIGEKSEINGSITHKFRYQKGQTDAAEVKGSDDVDTPTAGSFAEDNVGTAGVNWTHHWNALKVREDSILNAMNGGASDEMTRLKIASVMEEAVGMGFQRTLEKQQAQLWAGTLSSAQQAFSTQTWADYIGVTHWCDDGGTYGTVAGVDRTVEQELKAFTLNSTQLNNSAVLTLRSLRLARLGGSYNSYTDGPYYWNGNDTAGPRSRHNRAGWFVITTPALWEKLANDVSLSSTSLDRFNHDGIPAFEQVGFTNPVLKVDDMTVVFDYDCPSGEVYLLTPEFWTFEIQKGANFAIEPWTKKHNTEEGGAFYRWTTIHTKSRLTCRRPDLQVKLEAMTTA